MKSVTVCTTTHCRSMQGTRIAWKVHQWKPFGKHCAYNMEQESSNHATNTQMHKTHCFLSSNLYLFSSIKLWSTIIIYKLSYSTVIAEPAQEIILPRRLRTIVFEWSPDLENFLRSSSQIKRFWKSWNYLWKYVIHALGEVVPLLAI